jgi:DNA-binding CsgD family transcriptional regulator
LLSVAGDRGVLSVGEQTFLQVVGTAAIDRAEMLEEQETARPLPALTERERACVALLVTGLTERAIAAELEISAATARFHLDNARVKMRASSRAHLALLAAGLTQNLR